MIIGEGVKKGVVRTGLARLAGFTIVIEGVVCGPCNDTGFLGRKLGVGG